MLPFSFESENRTVREILSMGGRELLARDSAMFDFTFFPIALAQKIAGIGFTVSAERGNVHVHSGYLYTIMFH